MKVTKGDKVSAEVYARISGAPSHPTASSLSLLVGTLAQAYNNNSETATNNPNVLQVGVSFTPGNAGSQSSGLPNAYLRYVFYDETGTRAIQSGKFLLLRWHIRLGKGSILIMRYPPMVFCRFILPTKPIVKMCGLMISR
ncbi:hypothetical protein [uncultured Microscilla sp.]|uniref:hypothetical protein n=1 Tax=uncultured Microscilla sp. TaxID=432653 RepID=UPI002638C552|nr:hypothetical protein [uncultured Microscilla sp.]